VARPRPVSVLVETKIPTPSSGASISIEWNQPVEPPWASTRVAPRFQSKKP
jgi:hypothetical protein